MPYQYSLQLDGDALPLGTRSLLLYESLCLQIRICRRAYIDDSNVQELPEYAQAFTLLHEMLLHEDSARIFLSMCLSAMRIPIHDQDQMINVIASFYLDMCADPASSTCSGGAIHIVLANILIKIHDETQAVNRAMEESMDLAMFKAVPATKLSIEGLKKVKPEGSGSMEDDMFGKVLCQARSSLHVVLARLSWQLHCSVAGEKPFVSTVPLPDADGLGFH